MGQKERGHRADRQPTLCGAASGQYSDPGRPLSTNAPQSGLHAYRSLGGVAAAAPVRPVPSARATPGLRPVRGLRGRNPGRAGPLPPLWPAAPRRERRSERQTGCARCRALDLPYSRCVAPWAYEFPVTQLVQALKYEGALANARVFGTRLVAQALREQGDPLATTRHWSCPCRCTRRGSSSGASTSRTKSRGSCRACWTCGSPARVAPDSQHGTAGRTRRASNARAT